MSETPTAEKDAGRPREYTEVVADLLAEYGLTELPPAFLCRFDGAVHKRGIWHEGDTPLVPATRVTVEHRLVGTGCICGRWKAGLGESITRGFDLHLLDRRCASCGEPIPTTKRVDAETCSDRCARDRQRARVLPPAETREARP